ncbi:MAG: hypothetical protein RIF32_03440 [Leptospirales bacterium]
MSDETRAEMIASLYRNTNRLLLIPRARGISEELKNRKAPFQALYDFETGLARAAHPGRDWHPGAQYFYASYFKDRAAPYRTALHNLSAGGQLTGGGLAPLLARMDYGDGRSFVLLFIEDILRPLSASLADALRSIELDHHRLKDGLRSVDGEGRAAGTAQNAQRVGADFAAFKKKLPELTSLFLLRAEADPVLAPYVAGLRQADAALNSGPPRVDGETNDPTEEPPGFNASAGSDVDEYGPSDFVEIAALEPATTEARAPGPHGASGAASDFEAAPERQAATTESESVAAFATLAPDEVADFEARTAEIEPIANSAPGAPAEPAESSKAAPKSADAQQEATAREERKRFEEFLEARRLEMQDIERRLNQGLEECQQEIAAVRSIADPAERVDETSAALLGDDQYQHYRADLEEILADADRLFARVFALLSRLARRLTVAEMRRFVDHLIEELSRDEAIRAREPHLIPRLQNYRNSLKEDAPRLLNQIHARLAELRRESPSDPGRALREQLEYLQERLTDTLFQSIWPTVFTIYQNLVAQQFDAQVFREISEHLPLERQQRMLASLREGFREGGPARAAIERKLRGAELAGIGERIRREQTTGEIEELPEILARLESNHHFDPVERVRQEIQDFDAGRASQTRISDDGPRESSADEQALDPHQESGWTVERTRALYRAQPARALEFASRALSAGEVDAREKEFLCEYVEELAERDAKMARLYIFHRSVESAGGPREQLAMIRKFQDLVPPESANVRETNLRRAVARAPVPGLLTRALKEPDRTRRAAQLRRVLQNPHLPAGLRRVLGARRETPADAAFLNAFDTICVSPHPTRNKIQLLQTLGALARARGWLTEERARKLENRIRLYRRISQANQTMIARGAPERSFFSRRGAAFSQLLRAGRTPGEIMRERDQQVYGIASADRNPAGVTSPRMNTKAKASAASPPQIDVTSDNGLLLKTTPPDATDFAASAPALDEDFMNTPIELEHAAPAAKGAAPRAKHDPRSAGRNPASKAAARPGAPPNEKTKHAAQAKGREGAPGFLGKLMNRVTGNQGASNDAKSGKQETISIARLTTRAEKLFLKGDRRDPGQLLEILHTPEDLLELLHGMPEMKKNPAARRDKAAEAIKAAIAVTVVVPKSNRVLGMPGSLCFPRKDWNNELKRKNLVKSLNTLAEKQLPGSEKYNYYKFLSEEIQFNYYQGKYKHGRI